ncbi:MAG: hypothetical protein OXT69_02885 [Candidatus Poribacteria bacterium]|nr:hypothetical protein [Candidatus Poribacteria bacterium]
MKHARVVLASLFALIAADLSASPTFQAIGDIWIVRNPGPYARDASSGYATHRIKIWNRSSSETHRVHLRIPAEPRGLPGVNAYLHSVSKTFVIPPSSSVDALIHQPPLPVYREPTIAVSVIGKQEKGRVHFRSMEYLHAAALPTAVHPSFVSYAFEPRVLINVWRNHYAYIVLDQADKLISSASAGSRSSMAPPRPVNGSHYDGLRRAYYTTPPDVTSGIFKGNGSKPIWLNYTTFEGVVYSEEYAQHLTPAGRNALWRYVDCGGSLAYFGNGKMPAWWSELDPRLADKDLKHGAFEKYEIGFGSLYLVGEVDAPAASTGSTETHELPDGAINIAKSWYESEPTTARRHTAQGAADILPLGKRFNFIASLQRFFLMGLLLAVLIGPAQLFVLKRIKRREWVYWTTPALSILACGAFVLYASVTIGWRQQTRVVSLTHLDQQTGRAATIGWAAYYSPMTSGTELRFDENTELTPLAYGDKLVGSIDWTDGQLLTGGWVPARVPRHFKLRKNEDRPERIDLKKEGGALKVINRLGARVKSFWYADHDGKVYQASKVSNGSESVLTETNGVKIGLKKLRDVYACQDWVAEIEAVKASPAAYLQPGQYFAELKENVFVEKALEEAKAKPSISLVIGKF